jgi:hypothetical protein
MEETNRRQKLIKMKKRQKKKVKKGEEGNKGEESKIRGKRKIKTEKETEKWGKRRSNKDDERNEDRYCC